MTTPWKVTTLCNYHWWSCLLPRLTQMDALIIHLSVLSFFVCVTLMSALGDVIPHTTLKGHWTIFQIFFLAGFYLSSKKWLLIYNYKKERFKFKNYLWKWRNQNFLLGMHIVGMRLICIHVAVKNMVILNQNVIIYIMLS